MTLSPETITCLIRGLRAELAEKEKETTVLRFQIGDVVNVKDRSQYGPFTIVSVMDHREEGSLYHVEPHVAGDDWWHRVGDLQFLHSHVAGAVAADSPLSLEPIRKHWAVVNMGAGSGVHHVRYDSITKATEEAIRLCKLHPAQVFGVLEVVAAFSLESTSRVIRRKVE